MLRGPKWFGAIGGGWNQDVVEGEERNGCLRRVSGLGIGNWDGVSCFVPSW